MKILGSTVLYPPTTDNYTKTEFRVGVVRRTLEGNSDIHTRAIKCRWSFTLPEQGLNASLLPYLDGTPFEFEDLDGETYSVVLTGDIPVSGYPAVAEITLNLEEA